MPELTYEAIWADYSARHAGTPESELRRIHNKWKGLAAWVQLPKGKAPEDRGGHR